MIIVRWIQEFWFMCLLLFFLLLISRFVHLQVLVGFACIGGGVASEVVADGVEMMTM